jgi:hypothetical protein
LEEGVINEEIKNKRMDKITESIIMVLIEEFAFDVSVILRKAQTTNTTDNSLDNSHKEGKQFSHSNNLNDNKFLPVGPIDQNGIKTNFQGIRDFITKLKSFIIAN